MIRKSLPDSHILIREKTKRLNVPVMIYTIRMIAQRLAAEMLTNEIVLLMDCLAIHFKEKVLRAVRDAKIYIVLKPAGSTWLLQRLGDYTFGGFKRVLRALMLQHRIARPDQQPSKYDWNLCMYKTIMQHPNEKNWGLHLKSVDTATVSSRFPSSFVSILELHAILFSAERPLQMMSLKLVFPNIGSGFTVSYSYLLHRRCLLFNRVSARCKYGLRCKPHPPPHHGSLDLGVDDPAPNLFGTSSCLSRKSPFSAPSVHLLPHDKFNSLAEGKKDFRPVGRGSDPMPIHCERKSLLSVPRLSILLHFFNLLPPLFFYRGQKWLPALRCKKNVPSF